MARSRPCRLMSGSHMLCEVVSLQRHVQLLPSPCVCCRPRLKRLPTFFSHTIAGGDDGYEHYEERLRAVCGRYRQVVFIGDSMGATATLLFAHLATEVHAWTPQIDLATSSIRCDRGAAYP
jgi:acetyl esterase/lipase